MIVYYWLVDGVPPSGRNWTRAQIGRWQGKDLADMPRDDSGCSRLALLRNVLVVDEESVPWRIFRNDFGQIQEPGMHNLELSGFWWFFFREGHRLPQPSFPRIDQHGDIIAADGTIIMRGPDLLP